MRRSLLALALAGLAVFTATPSEAQVVARINRATQTMRVWVDGQYAYEWPVSTGARGYATPAGSYRAQRLAKRYFSRKYDNAPMHNAVFFHGGYAIHGTSYVSQLGTAASHGCVRLHPSNAEQFFELVRSRGAGRTRISITR
jgi:lipoprotein-anchoring transpeptidase ErfK/SrfK